MKNTLLTRKTFIQSAGAALALAPDAPFSALTLASKRGTR